MTPTYEGFSADEAGCRHFNRVAPPGTRVRYWPVMNRDESVETTTRSEAWLLGSGHAVVLISGRTGGVSIAHLEVVR